VVYQVEDFRAELEAHVFTDREALVHGEIGVDDAGQTDRVGPRRRAEAAIGSGVAA